MSLTTAYEFGFRRSSPGVSRKKQYMPTISRGNITAVAKVNDQIPKIVSKRGIIIPAGNAKAGERTANTISALQNLEVVAQ